MRARRSVFLIFAAAVAYDVSRTLLGLEIDFTDILTDNTNTHHLHTGKETDDTGRARPALRRVLHEVYDECVDKKNEAYESYDKAEPCDDLDRLNREARYTIECETEQLGDGVVSLAGHSLVSVVVYACALEAYHGEETS